MPLFILWFFHGKLNSSCCLSSLHFSYCHDVTGCLVAFPPPQHSHKKEGEKMRMREVSKEERQGWKGQEWLLGRAVLQPTFRGFLAHFVVPA